MRSEVRRVLAEYVDQLGKLTRNKKRVAAARTANKIWLQKNRHAHRLPNKDDTSGVEELAYAKFNKYYAQSIVSHFKQLLIWLDVSGHAKAEDKRGRKGKINTDDNDVKLSGDVDEIAERVASRVLEHLSMDGGATSYWGTVLRRVVADTSPDTVAAYCYVRPDQIAEWLVRENVPPVYREKIERLDKLRYLRQQKSELGITADDLEDESISLFASYGHKPPPRKLGGTEYD
jgi:hypothetical protein